MTALVQAGLEAFLLLFALVGKKDCFRFPMNVGWCIKICDTHVQNAINVMFPEIFLIIRLPRSSVGVDIPNICATAGVDLWFVADYSCDEKLSIIYVSIPF